ncbi:(2Fe-2S)-binding protein [Nocardiopsis sp. HNM0947]|uniref:(2Fe-2S)-binding protein n=1 Tax=Nocardiopsis coralli TaxID=2772213 RepID=A0ABR9P520_9ACTN|nr:(2Fe-2S)-binding protein [Nocardiopsis coralli]MBE2998931.1 (2Fe-2S)-binding protein [Nocardiopsis coralli]
MPRSRGTTPTAREAVADIARIGGFFDVTSHPDLADSAPGEGPWRPLAEVWGPDVLGSRIERTRRLFAERMDITPEEVEPRVAASVLYQGMAARLVSPAMAAAVVHGVVPEPGALRWRTISTGPLPLLLAEDRAVPAPRPREHGPAAAAEVVERVVVQGLLEPAAAAFRARVKVSPKVLTGNLASSVAGAARRIAEVRPEHGADAHALAGALVAAPSLEGSGTFGPPRTVTGARGGSHREIQFVRNSCCLYYRLPGGGMCADCVLLRGVDA